VKLSEHIVLGGGAAIALAPTLGARGSLVFWASSVLIDVDHHWDYVYRNGFSDWSPAGMFAYHERMFAQIHRPDFLAMNLFHTAEWFLLVACAMLWQGSAILFAMLLGMVSQGVMNLVMTSTPLAMVGCGLTISSAAYAIQWHIIGMYAPSFLTGRLIARFGIARIGLAGCAILVVCGVVAESGLSVVHFNIALLLLGIGWNFAFLSATATVTSVTRPQERAKVQATNDFVVFGGTAFAAYFSGVLLGAFGWNGIAATVFPAAVLGVALIFASRRAHRLAMA